MTTLATLVALVVTRGSALTAALVARQLNTDSLSADFTAIQLANGILKN
jgi:hypothetical protein